MLQTTGAGGGWNSSWQRHRRLHPQRYPFFLVQNTETKEGAQEWRPEGLLLL